MRVDQPCSSEESVLPEGSVIITHTDLQTGTTCANEAFLQSSGFPLDECMGQPQNLIRHPDMPPEAFRDLWRTLEAA